MNIAAATPDRTSDATPDSFWRSLSHLNQFRLFLSAALGVVGLAASQTFSRLDRPGWFLLTCLIYFLLAWSFRRPLRLRLIRFEHQVMQQVATDLASLGALIHFTGGNASGLGLLLMVSVAAVGMLRERLMVVFWAACASFVVLGEQLLQLLGSEPGVEGFFRAGMLSIGFFGVALLSHTLAISNRAAAILAGEKVRQAEDLARLNERMIQELPYAVMALDGAGQVRQFNARALSLLGDRLAAGVSLAEFAPRLAELWTLWCKGLPVPGYPIPAGPHSGRVRARFVELDASRNEGAVVVLEDVTELEAQAQKMKLASLGLLAANLAHEIRNPLSAIRHAAGLLKEDVQGDVPAKLTRIIDDNVVRLNGLVEDVLVLSRRDRMNREVIALTEFLPPFVQQFMQREGVPEQTLHLQLQLAGNLRTCMDVLHLEQILWNLLRNASHYCSKREGSIRIVVEEVDNLCRIDVLNDGPAIPIKEQARLFEPFYTTDKQGTGLGLYIARELAEANRAVLQYVDNPAGAQFRLSCATAPCQLEPSTEQSTKRSIEPSLEQP